MSFVDYFFHTIETLFLKNGIAHRQHLIENDNLRIQMGGDRKRQPHVHPAGIVFHRYMDEFFQAGEIDNAIESFANLLSRQPEHRSVEKNVVSSGELRVKSSADFK